MADIGAGGQALEAAGGHRSQRFVGGEGRGNSQAAGTKGRPAQKGASIKRGNFVRVKSVMSERYIIRMVLNPCPVEHRAGTKVPLHGTARLRRNLRTTVWAKVRQSICLKNATDDRPKWGLYRGMVSDMHDDWVEHKDVTTRKLD